MKESKLEETWQVDVSGQIYETNFEGLVNWISEGSLMRGDKIRRGNLRWLEAGKIPLLFGFFNAKEAGQPMPPVQFSTTDAENQTHSAENFAATQNFSSNFAPPENFPPDFANPQLTAQDFCIIHADAPACFFCDTCLNSFCSICPKSYGGNVKICPMCGSMCKAIEVHKVEQQQVVQYNQDLNQGFGFSDFGNALAYPFKFKTSYILGAIFFMFFTLGTTASAVGGIMMFSASLTCFMLSNMLTFGIMANVLENFAQGKIGGNFMPGFDDFNLWDDFVQPFFLSIAVYLVSFGLMIVLTIGAAWYMFNQISGKMENMPGSTMQSQVETANKLRQQTDEFNERSYWENGQMPDSNTIANKQTNAINREEQEFQEMEKMIGQQRKAELESVAGKNPEEQNAQTLEMFSGLLKTGGIFLVLIFLAFLWGVFYFPAACCVAGYTRSFKATMNPSVGLDTIKRLGGDYVKILAMGLVLVIISGIITAILNIIFFPFNLPKMGNLPAIAVGSWFTFYFSIVFSLILGFALYKNAEKMNLFRG